MKEYKYKLLVDESNILKLSLNKKNITYGEAMTHEKNQFDIVYRYYKIGSLYCVKIVKNNNIRWFKWIGGETHVVQVGDQIDRCRPIDSTHNTCDRVNITKEDEDSDLEIMLFYDSINKIARMDGGRVFSLLGNHEIMNVVGDMRYVSREGLLEYSPEPKNVDDGLKVRKDKFETIISRKMACTRSTILIIGDYLFVHGGIAHKLSYTYKILDINSIIRKFLHGSLKKHSNLKQILHSSKTSPLWYRELAYIDEDVDGKQNEKCDTLFQPILNELNDGIVNISTEPIIQVKGMVIGHTPQFIKFNKGITTACNNRIIRTDIGASMAFDYFAKSDEQDKTDKARIPQVIEILTDLNTRVSTIKVLIKS
jgi:hypothetical protein